MREVAFIGAIFILLAGYVFLYDLPVSRNNRSLLLSSTDLHNLREIKIKQANHQELRLLFSAAGSSKKEDLSLRVSLPGIENSLLSQERLKKFLIHLERIELEQTLLSLQDSELSDFGLDPANAQLVFLFKSGHKVSLDLGKYNPLVDSRYALVSSSSWVQLIDENVAQGLISLDKVSIREAGIFATITGEIGWLSREIEGESDLMLELENSRWMVNGEPGDPRFIDQLVDNLTGLKAKGFVLEDEIAGKDFGFYDPLLEITFREQVGTENKIRMLTIGARVDDLPDSDDSLYYARTDSSAVPYLLDYKDFKPLLVSKAALTAIEDFEK